MTASHRKNPLFPSENEKSPRLRRDALISIFSCDLGATPARCRKSGGECYEIAEFCSHFIHTWRFPCSLPEAWD